MTSRAAVSVFGSVLAMACAAETTSPSASSASKPVPAAPAASIAKPAEAAKSTTPVVEFQETDFSESERSRDPFHSFAKYFAEEARTKIKSQREVVLDQYSLDELRL